jgi:hypothetical protein
MDREIDLRQARYVVANDDHVDGSLLQQAERLGCGPGLCYDLKPIVLLKGTLESLEDHGLVVHEHDADRLVRR